MLRRAGRALLRVLLRTLTKTGWLLLFLLLLPVSAVLHLDTPAARRAASFIALQALGGALRGKFEIGSVRKIEPSFGAVGLELSDVVIRDPRGRRVIRAHRVVVRGVRLLRPFAQGSGIAIRIESIVADGVAVHLIRRADLLPSLISAFEPRGPSSDSEGPTVRVEMPDIRLRRGLVYGDLPGIDNLHAENVTARARITVEDGVEIAIARATLATTSPFGRYRVAARGIIRAGEPERRTRATSRPIAGVEPPPVTDPTNAEVDLHVDARAMDGPERVRAQVRYRGEALGILVEDSLVSARTLAPFDVQVPLRGTVAVRGHLGGHLDGLRMDATVVAEGGRAVVRGELPIGRPLHIEADVSDVDLSRVIEGAPESRITGHAVLGPGPRNLPVRIEITTQRSRIAGFDIPPIVATADVDPEAERIYVQPAETRDPRLTARVEGTVGFDGTTDLIVDADDVHIRALPLPEDLDLPVLGGVASANVRFRFSPAAPEQGRARAWLSVGGRLRSHGLRVGPVTAATLTFSGTVSGSAEQPSIRGVVNATGVRVADLRIATVHTTVLGGPAGGGRSTFAFNVDAHGLTGRRDVVQGSGDLSARLRIGLDSSGVDLDASDLAITIGEQRWRGQIDGLHVGTRGDILLRRALLAAGSQRLEASAARHGRRRIEGSLIAQSLDLTELLTLSPVTLPVTRGRLDVSARTVWEGRFTRIEVEAGLTEATVGPLDEISAVLTLGYDGESVVFDTQTTLQTGGSVALGGRIDRDRRQRDLVRSFVEGAWALDGYLDGVDLRLIRAVWPAIAANSPSDPTELAARSTFAAQRETAIDRAEAAADATRDETPRERATQEETPRERATPDETAAEPESAVATRDDDAEEDDDPSAPPDLGGIVTGNVRFSGSLETPAGEASLEATGLTFEGSPPAHATVTAAFTEGVATARVALRNTAGPLAEAEATLPLDLETIGRQPDRAAELIRASDWRLVARVAPVALATLFEALPPAMRPELENPIALRVGGQVTATGPEERLAIEATGRVDWTGQAADVLLTAVPHAQIQGTYRDGEASVRADVSVGGSSVLSATATAPMPLARWLRGQRAEIPPLALAVTGDRVPASLFAPLRTGHMGGTFEVRAFADGILGDPTARVLLRGHDVTIGGIPIGNFTLRATANASQLRGDLDVQAHREGRPRGRAGMQAHVEIPIRWRRGITPSIRDDQGLLVNVAMFGQPVRPFAPFVPGVNDARGLLDGDIEYRGRLQNGRWNGTARLSNGSVDLAGVGQRLDGVRLEVRFTNDRVELVELRAEDGGDEVRASGELLLRGLNPRSGSVRAVFDAFPIRNEGQIMARLEGRLNATFAITDNELSATVSPRNLFVHLPDRPPGELQNLELNPDIEVVGEAPREVERGRAGFVYRIWFAGGNREIWVRRSDFSVRTVTDVRVRYDGRDLGMTGSIEITRGWFEMLGKRFELDRGRVVFDNPDELDPALSITAQHEVTSASTTVTVEVNGRLTRPVITFSSNPALGSESEVIALLVTGRGAESTTGSTEDSGTLRDQAGEQTTNIVAGLTVGLVQSRVREEAPWLQVFTVDQSGDRYRIRAGVPLTPPRFLRPVLTNVFVQLQTEFETSSTQGTADTTTGAADPFSGIIELTHPGNLRSTLSAGSTSGRFGIDFAWDVPIE